VIKIPNTFEAEHIKELQKLHDDGFVDLHYYKNSAGAVRQFVSVVHQVGIEGTNVRAFNPDRTVVNWAVDGVVSECTVGEWYKWLGPKWSLDSKVDKPIEDVLDKQAELAAKTTKTKPYEIKDGDTKWVKASQSQRKNVS
jgi:hypothetical protein